jgi:hypothetical protein
VQNVLARAREDELTKALFAAHQQLRVAGLPVPEHVSDPDALSLCLARVARAVSVNPNELYIQQPVPWEGMV